MEEKKLTIYPQIRTKNVLIKMEYCDGYLHEILTSGNFDLPLFIATPDCDVQDIMMVAEDMNDFIQSTYVEYMHELSTQDSALENIKFWAGTLDYIVNELITAIKQPKFNKEIQIYRTPAVIITDKVRERIRRGRIFDDMSVEVYITIKDE